MDIDSLAQRLRDPDPRVRVETLRILAMVEETRALSAIRWICQYDPEPGVREVADWAGRLIWKARQRGHSTQHAVEEMFDRPMSPENQERFLAALAEFDLAWTGNLSVRKYAADQAYRRQLTEALLEQPYQTERVPADENLPVLPAPTPESPDTPERADTDDLLDAGLTNLLPE